MQATFRPGIREDAQACGAVFYDAFKLIAEEHNFPVDFPLPETAVSLLTMLLSRDDIYSVVAEMERGIVGSNFLWEGDVIAAGRKPKTISCTCQSRAAESAAEFPAPANMTIQTGTANPANSAAPRKNGRNP